jgi:hypothetical protein
LYLYYTLLPKDPDIRIPLGHTCTDFILRSNSKTRIKRALILQGGGALGAYELGVYRALCERLIEKDKSDGTRKNRPLFVLDATSAVTFDSYLCETRYDDGRKNIQNNKETTNEHILNYRDGITMQHVRATEGDSRVCRSYSFERGIL